MKFKKNDWILLGMVALLILGSFAAYRFLYQSDGDLVQIRIDSKIVKTLPLDTDTVYTIQTTDGQTNVLVIKNRHASIRDASCPDKLCVHQKAISKTGESLICLPHKVVVSICSDQASELDAVAN